MDNQPTQPAAPAQPTQTPVTASPQPIMPTAQTPATPPAATPVTPPQQPAPATTPSVPAAAASGTKPAISFDFDSRTKTTMQWSAIWYGVGAIIQNVASQLSILFMGGIAGEIFRSFGGFFNTFSFPMLLNKVIWGVITGAVAGFVISKFYPQIQDLNRKYLKSKLNTLFKLLFYPSLIGAALGFLISSSVAFITGFMPLIIVTAGVIVSSFIYAKMLTKKIEGLYQPPA